MGEGSDRIVSAVDEIRENEIAYCRKNIEYFVRGYGHIEDKDAAELIQRFELWPEQEETLRKFRDEKLCIALKCRW